MLRLFDLCDTTTAGSSKRWNIGGSSSSRRSTPGKYMPPALTALGNAEVERATARVRSRHGEVAHDRRGDSRY
jgi:hypothetical protein